MPELARNPPGGGPEGVDHSADEEQIAQLERLIAEKEQAVISAVLSATEVQQQLETSRAETRALKAQLDATRDRSQAEANSVKARLQQARYELDHERQMRRADSAAYSAKIASLQREASGPQAVSQPVDAPRSVWARLSACALIGALAVCLYVGWLRLSGTSATMVPARKASTRESDIARTPVVASPSRENVPAPTYSAPSEPPDKNLEESPAERKTRLKNLNPEVCDFQRIGDLPTILYRGKDSLTAILSRCTLGSEDASAQ